MTAELVPGESDISDSSMKNPRSAITTSVGTCSRVFKKPEFSLMCLSLVRPLHPLEINVIAPCGAIPMKYFKVSLAS